MNVFVFTDIHSGRYNIPEVELVARKLVWGWVMQHAKEADLVLFLGDRCRSRDPEGLIRDESDEAFHNLTKLVPVIALCGNHDYYFKQGSLANNYGLLYRWENLSIISQPVVLTIAGRQCEFVPYGHQPKGEGDYLFMHDEIEGIMGWSHAIKKEVVQNYKVVYSGHIHDRIIKGHIKYIGVPFQQGHGDGELTGGLFLNMATGKERWVDGIGPKFITGIRNNMEGCIARVNTEEEFETAKSRGALRVELIDKEEQTTVQEVEKIDGSESWKDWVDEYVERNGNGDATKKDVGHMIIDAV